MLKRFDVGERWQARLRFARLGDKWRATRSPIRRVFTKMRVVRWALISSAEALGTIREFVNSMKEQDAKIELLHVGESEPLIRGGDGTIMPVALRSGGRGQRNP